MMPSVEWVGSAGLGSYEWTTSKGDHVVNRDFFAGSAARERGSRSPDVALVVEETPWVFLTIRPPGNVIEPHFHEVPQYQIFVEGDGCIGKHPLQPIEVHYTDAYTPYGPIVASERGLAFITLRTKTNNGGAHYMPASRRMLARKAGRALTARAALDSSSDGTELIPLTQDGVEAKLLSIEPGGSTCPSITGPSSGRFLLVLSGALLRDDAEFGRYSCIHVPASQEPPEITAGGGGAKVLSLQLPIDGNMAIA